MFEMAKLRNEPMLDILATESDGKPLVDQFYLEWP